MKLSKYITPLLFFLSVIAHTQPGVRIAPFYKKIKTEDYLLPIKPECTISFTTDEGSYMNVDISPDGKNILFDLLGDIYLLPFNGGTAKQLTRGIAVKVRPVWSPDGKHFVYVSDACGTLCLNIRNISGTFHKIVNTPLFWSIDVPDPKWTPDGNEIIFKDSVYQVFAESIPGYNISNFLVGFSSNGKFSYFKDIIEDRGTKMVTNGYMLMKHNNLSGTTDTIVKEKKQDIGNAKISPDGKWLVYVRGHWWDKRQTDSLVARDLINGEEKFLTILHFRVINNKFDARALHYSFSSDSKMVYIGFRGKIHSIDLENAKVTNIPFVAKVSVDFARRSFDTFDLSHNTFPVRYIRSAHRNNDGNQMVFVALNRIFIMDLPTGKPRQLVQQPFAQFQPSYSPDGKWIAYVTWADKEGGQVWKVRSTGGPPEQVTKVAGYYQNPSWSHDGNNIVVVKGKIENGIPKLGEVQLVDLKAETVHIIDEKVPVFNLPVFSIDDKNIMYKPLAVDKTGYPWTGYHLIPQIVSKNIANQRVKTLAIGASDYYNELEQVQFPQVLPSPDGELIVYVYNENLYLALVGNENLPKVIYDPSKKLPTIRIAHGAMDPHWEDNGKTLSWTFADKYYKIPVQKLHLLVKDLADSLQYSTPTSSNFSFIDAKITPDTYSIILQQSCYKSEGITAIKNVKIVTMEGDSIIHHGTIVINKGRFAAIGKSEMIDIPDGAKEFDFSNKIIIPGLIDLHSHMQIKNGDILLQQPWQLLSNFAYGVTTLRDPGGNFQLVGYDELIETGQMVGPRSFGVGGAVRENYSIDNLDEAHLVVKNRAQFGAIAIKQYDQQSRLKRQWLKLASEKYKLNMTNEGSFMFPGVLGMLKDASPGIEHFNPLGYETYKDVEILMAASKTYFAPTMQISNQGGEQGVFYFRDQYKKLNDSNRLKRFTPQNEMSRILKARRDNHRNPPDVYVWSRLGAKVRSLGGNIIMGSHGEDQGIGAHFELWALQMGGLSNLEALQAATIMGAKALGMQKDLGSIGVGKIADLIVLDKNPLEDIHNTLSIKYVMKDGILYDADTLEVVWSGKVVPDDKAKD